MKKNNEFYYHLEEGECVLTGLPTHFKFKGEWISLAFLTAGKKLYEKYKQTDPDLTLEKAVETVISAQVYRVTNGEDRMEGQFLKGKTLWQLLPQCLDRPD